MMTDHVGQQLGNYRLVRLLEHGAFAEVYLGEHVYLETQAAIKVLQTQLASEDLERFRLEARIIAHLEHPHIVRVLDFGVEDSTPFLVMSYAPKGTLRTRHPKGSRLPLPMVVSYVQQIAPALQYAHAQRLIHRDVKPENLLLGNQNELLLSDFGIALVTQSSRYQSTHDIAGTLAYMAPEQIEAHPQPASDQYSLGIVVYEWLCGECPFHGSLTEIATKHLLMSPQPLREKVPDLSLEVEQVVLTALVKDPRRRWASVQAFATALEQASQILFDPTLPAQSTPHSKGASTEAHASLQANMLTPQPSFLPNTPFTLANQIFLPTPPEPPPLLPKLLRETTPSTALPTRVWEWLTGHLPFIVRHFLSMGWKHMHEQLLRLRHSDPQMPIATEAAILKAMAKRQTERLADVAALQVSFPLAPVQKPAAPPLSVQLSDLVPASTVFVTPLPTPLGRTKEQWIDVGNECWRAKRYIEALTAYEQAICIDPNAVSAYHGKGNTLGDLNRYEEALNAYEQAIRLDPNSAYGYFGRGNTLYKLRRYEEALSAYAQAIHLDPSAAYVYNGVGNTLRNLKRYEEALSAYEQAIYLNPSYDQAYNSKGNALGELKRYEEALSAYEQSIRLNPNSAIKYSNKGNALYKLKRYREALTAFEQAISLDPNLAQVYQSQGDTLYDLKRYKEALGAYEQALRLDPNSAFVYYGKGNAWYKLKRYKEALGAYEQAISLDPNLAQAYQGQGDILYDLKRYREALSVYEQAIRLNPNFADTYSSKADTLKKLGRTNET